MRHDAPRPQRSCTSVPLHASILCCPPSVTRIFKFGTLASPGSRRSRGRWTGVQTWMTLNRTRANTSGIGGTGHKVDSDWWTALATSRASASDRQPFTSFLTCSLSTPAKSVIPRHPAPPGPRRKAPPPTSLPPSAGPTLYGGSTG